MGAKITAAAPLTAGGGNNRRGFIVPSLPPISTAVPFAPQKRRGAALGRATRSRLCETILLRGACCVATTKARTASKAARTPWPPKWRVAARERLYDRACAPRLAILASSIGGGVRLSMVRDCSDQTASGPVWIGIVDVEKPARSFVQRPCRHQQTNEYKCMQKRYLERGEWQTIKKSFLLLHKGIVVRYRATAAL